MDMNMITEHALVTTVKSNKEKYTTRDVGKATVERKLQSVIGSSSQYLVISVRSHIKNFPVIAADAKLAEKIYGPNIAVVRGKTVWINKLAYEVDQIPISVPSKYRMVTLASNIFYVNTVRFLVSILKYIRFGTTQPIDNVKVETLEIP